MFVELVYADINNFREKNIDNYMIISHSLLAVDTLKLEKCYEHYTLYFKIRSLYNDNVIIHSQQKQD